MPDKEKRIMSKLKKAVKNGKIKFAQQDETNSIPVDYLIDFFEKIIKIRYWDCFISDESSINDFPEDAEVYADRIKKIYNVDIVPKDRNMICDIVKKIKKRYNKE